MGKFECSGPLRSDSALFRGFRKELDELRRLCLGAEQGYAIVYGGHRTGKTSLLYRLMGQLPASVATCYVDYSQSAEEFTTTSQAIQYLARCISQKFSNLQLSAEVNTFGEMDTFLLLIMKGLAPARLILMLEGLGRLPEACRRNLANMMRAIFTRSRCADTAYQPLDRLVFILAGSLELHALVVSPPGEVSPLNSVCKTIYLSDLSRAEAVGLMVGELEALGLPAGDARELGEGIYTQVAGHPYLTQCVGGILEQKWNETRQLTLADLDQAIDELRVTHNFLLHLHHKMQQLNLAAAAQMLLEKDRPFTRHDLEMVQLELIGLATRSADGRNWVARNPLFRQAMWNWLGGPTIRNDPAAPQVNSDAGLSLEAAILRLYAANAQPVGVGFWIGERRALTCAHVVAAALRVDPDSPQAPLGEISFDRPLFAPGKIQKAKVVLWQPAQRDGGGDIAGLELLEDSPPPRQPPPVFEAADLRGHRFWAFGFPPQHDAGVWTSGVFSGRQANGWVQIEGTTEPGYRVQPGFSGGPVWDELLKKVVGMVVASESDPEVKAGFIIPTALLPKVWPAL